MNRQPIWRRHKHVNQRSNRKQIRRVVGVFPALVRCLLLWTIPFVPFAWLNGAYRNNANAQESGASAPLWQKGVSTWDGKGYSAPSDVSTDEVGVPVAVQSVDLSSSEHFDLPPVPDFDAPPNSVEATPYTVPVSPPNSYGNVTDPYANAMQQHDPMSASIPPGIPGVSSVVPIQSQVEPGPGPTAAPIADYDPLGAVGEPLVDLTAYNGSAGPTMTQRLNAAANSLQAPLSTESSRWYSYPWRWMTTGWTNHIELGIDGSTGNSETLAIQTGAEITRKTDAYTLAFDVDYRLVNSQNVVTEDNGRFNIDFDRLINGSKWSWFTKFGLEYDEFKVFDLRLNLAGGIAYHWIRNDRTTFLTRFGAGASREIGAPDDDWIPEAVFGFDAEHQLNKYNKLRAQVDYFPNWEDFSDFRVVSDFAWEILLDDKDSLSLKLAVTDRYDSTPQGGAEDNDFYYSLLLLVKF